MSRTTLIITVLVNLGMIGVHALPLPHLEPLAFWRIFAIGYSGFVLGACANYISRRQRENALWLRTIRAINQ